MSPADRIRRYARGFSLVELAATLALATTLLGLAIPSLRSFVLDARRTAVVNEMLAVVQLAHATALTTSRYATLCPSIDGRTCATSADWSAGWIVYGNTDRLYSGVEPDAGEPVFRYVANDHSQVQVGAAGRRSFTFRPFQINSDNGTITICDERGLTDPAARRAIVINTVGRPRISVRKADGSALECR